MNPSELFGILHNLFGKANPKVIVKTNFTDKEHKLLSLLILKCKQTNNPYDKALLTKTYLRILSDRDKVAYQRALIKTARSNLVPPEIRSNLLKTKDQLSFRPLSPAGPARFARVPFYPIRDEEAWSSRFLDIDTTTPSIQSFGIDESGDDPILAVGPWLSTSNVTTAGPYTLATRKIEFGAYRLIGVEISAQYGQRYIGAVATGGGAIAATGSVTFDGPAAVAATGELQIVDPPGGMTVTIQDAAGTTVVFTCVIGAPGVDQFEKVADVAVTAGNLATAINANAFFVSAVNAGDRVTLTMDTVGAVGNGKTLTTSNLGGIPVISAFSGGSDNVTEDSTITVIDADGLSKTFTAKTSGAGALEFTISQVSAATTANNFLIKLNADPIKITGAAVGNTVNLTQDTAGSAGNTTIATSFPGGGVTGFSATGFTGGQSFISLGLAGDLSPIALSIRELTVYNGDNILVVEDSEAVSATSFNILNRPETFQYTYEYPSGTSITPTGQPAAPLTKFKKEAGYKFIGLRDQPIVDPNSQVFVKVAGFIQNTPTFAGGGYPPDTPLPKIPPISLSINLIVDLLEDKIFGDPIIPSPASRPAANIKLGKRTLGYNKLEVTNTISKKPEL